MMLTVWKSEPVFWTYQLSALLDVPFDTALVLICAGLVGPIGDRADELAEVAILAAARRQRQIHQKLVKAAISHSGPAVTLASLFEGVDPDILISQAVDRFRCIPWEVLSGMPEIIVAGGPLDVVGAGVIDLHTFATPCRIGGCDAFFSHSWHDDAHLKLDALSDWCTEFANTQQRSPRLWLDKVCIDQENINADLQCLPIFLAGCNSLLIISGLTYVHRLWCCVELFVYVQMTEEDATHEAPTVLTIGEEDAVHARLRNAFRKFDSAACDCFNPADKTRMFAVIAGSPGGVPAFNDHVRQLASNLFGEARGLSLALPSVVGAQFAPQYSWPQSL